MNRRSSSGPGLTVLTVLTVLTLLACGGKASAPAVPADGAKTGGADTPAERCLAIAGATRAKRPDEPARITARHILVKYAGAKKATPTTTRTREEACLRALEAREKLEQGASFAEVVASYSEEPGAATREGSLGAIERGDVVAPFADAAFELGRGEVSHVVETDFGFHIIMRTE